jgi:hypothetical protein
VAGADTSAEPPAGAGAADAGECTWNAAPVGVA